MAGKCRSGICGRACVWKISIAVRLQRWAKKWPLCFDSVYSHLHPLQNTCGHFWAQVENTQLLRSFNHMPSRKFHSCIFQPCKFVRAEFSTPAFLAPFSENHIIIIIMSLFAQGSNKNSIKTKATFPKRFSTWCDVMTWCICTAHTDHSGADEIYGKYGQRAHGRNSVADEQTEKRARRVRTESDAHRAEDAEGLHSPWLWDWQVYIIETNDSKVFKFGIGNDRGIP